MNEKELLIALKLTQHNHRVLMGIKNKQLEEEKSVRISWHTGLSETSRETGHRKELPALPFF